MIQGAALRPLTRHVDARGSLTELLRSDWPEFDGFGQATLTVNLPSVVRAWHWHERQTDRFVVVAGTAKIALYDARPGSTTHREVNDFVLGADDFALLVVPPGVYHGYVTVGDEPALIVNFPDHLYDPGSPDEGRMPFDSPEIPYRWGGPELRS